MVRTSCRLPVESRMTSSRYTQFLLLGIAASLTILQLRLVWNTGQLKGLEPYFLCYAAVWFMMWRKRDRLHQALRDRGSNTLSATSVGLLCITWVLYRSTLISSYDSFLRFSPIVSGLGLALLGFGSKQIKQYWRELLVLSFLMIPTTTITELIDLSKGTATLAGNLLWYSGFPVVQEDTKLIMPTGFVDVYPGCSGIQSILQLLTLSFLFLMLFPMRWVQTLFIPTCAIAIAFIVNGVRVALMAVLFAQSNESAFDYWHLGEGSQVFSMVAVLIFGGICYLFLEYSDASSIDKET
jgi:cyanoexosortase A